MAVFNRYFVTDCFTKIIALFAIFIIFPIGVASADSIEEHDELNIDPITAVERRRDLLRNLSISSLNISPQLPEGVDASGLNEETYQQYQTSLKAYYAYFEEGYTIRRNAFGWQEFSTKVIFWLVIFLVLLGMYFAAIQFHSGIFKAKNSTAKKIGPVSEFEPRGPSQDVEEEVIGAGLDSDIEISLSGVKVSSPIVGVVILIVSLAFFYLYLVYVYPVQDSF